MKTIVIEATPCPSCGKPMPAGALAGLCPACLLAQGAETDAGDASSGRFVPPPLDKVAKLFPQLEMLGLLGAGGMGAVYKARQPALDRIVALKILPSQNAGGVNFTERFNREARALARLSHPNIVAVHEFGQAAGLHFFIMEFVDGANLRQLEYSGRLSPREALQIIPQICDALQYAHDESVVHRDIKPENVLIDRKGRVKIADFGLAKIMGQNADAHRLTMEGQVMGTPHYMAPEQVERPLTVDHRADIYALGVVFYEMLTGDLPLGKFPPPSRKFQLDVRLDDVVLRALENDPARRYQRASDVKTQVETIASTVAPGASATAVSPAEPNYVRWMNFPLVVERDGKRQVNRKGAFKAFAIIFGLLTLAFLLVSIATGRSLFGWLGISGGASLKVRLVIAAIVVAWGVWRAWRQPADEARVAEVELPRTPRGTVVLPPPGLSRKAAFGACWAPAFFIAALLLFAPGFAAGRGFVVDFSLQAMKWWQILLGVLILPVGVTAPFGTTILGWLAVRDIRRSRGIVTGLPLAVFDGLFFPLVAYNALLVWAWTTGVRVVAEGVGKSWFTGQWSAIASFGAVAICLLATVDISWRVWKAVRASANGSSAPSAWGRRVLAGLTAPIIVAAVLIALVIGNQRSTGRTAQVPARQHAAELDAKTGAMAARVAKRGTVSLVAVSDTGAPPNEWWRPDGVAMPDMLYEVYGVAHQTNAGFKARDFIVRWRDLPEGASGPTLKIEPSPGGMAAGGTVFRDGKELSGTWAVRTSFPPSAQRATVSLGFAVDLWQSISTFTASGDSSTFTMLPETPDLHGRLHQIIGDGGETVVMMIRERETSDWNTRVVAVDTNGVEHAFFSAVSTVIEKSSLWTYKFKVPRAQVKEFQVQVRPVRWVEFRNVPLEPADRSALGKSKRTFVPTRFSEVKEVEINELFDFDKGKPGGFPVAVDGSRIYRGIERNPSWIREHGFDADAGTNELRLAEVGIADFNPAEWETLAPVELMERMNRSLYVPPSLPSTANARLPLTHGFRTRQDKMGLLQVTGFADGKAGVKLRYKVVERAHFE